MDKEVLLKIERLSTVGAIKVFGWGFPFLFLFSLFRLVHLVKKPFEEVCVFRSPRLLPHIDLWLQFYAVDGLVLQLEFL